MSPGRAVSTESTNRAWVWAASTGRAARQNNRTAAKKFSARRTPLRCPTSESLQTKFPPHTIYVMIAGAKGASCNWLCTGQWIFPAMLTAIVAATKSICLETYVYSSGTLGLRFRDALRCSSRTSGLQATWPARQGTVGSGWRLRLVPVANKSDEGCHRFAAGSDAG